MTGQMGEPGRVERRCRRGHSRVVSNENRGVRIELRQRCDFGLGARQPRPGDERHGLTGTGPG